jgi:hypothetical protein
MKNLINTFIILSFLTVGALNAANVIPVKPVKKIGDIMSLTSSEQEQAAIKNKISQEIAESQAKGIEPKNFFPKLQQKYPDYIQINYYEQVTDDLKNATDYITYYYRGPVRFGGNWAVVSFKPIKSTITTQKIGSEVGSNGTQQKPIEKRNGYYR